MRGLVVCVALCMLVVGGVRADSPPLCAPQSATDKYRLLRQYSLDLLGRIPSAAEYAALHENDEIPRALLDDMLNSEEFLAQLRTYHRDLLWTGMNATIAFTAGQRLSRRNGIGPWFVGSRSRLYR